MKGGNGNLLRGERNYFAPVLETNRIFREEFLIIDLANRQKSPPAIFPKFLALYPEKVPSSSSFLVDLIWRATEKNATAIGAQASRLCLLIKKTLIKYSSQKKGFCSQERCPHMRFPAELKRRTQWPKKKS